jgi:hypothetical protein
MNYLGIKICAMESTTNFCYFRLPKVQCSLKIDKHTERGTAMVLFTYLGMKTYMTCTNPHSLRMKRTILF